MYRGHAAARAKPPVSPQVRLRHYAEDVPGASDPAVSEQLAKEGPRVDRDTAALRAALLSGALGLLSASWSAWRHQRTGAACSAPTSSPRATRHPALANHMSSPVDSTLTSLGSTQPARGTSRCPCRPCFFEHRGFPQGSSA